MILESLTPQQQELLRATCGNPNLEAKLADLVAAIGAVESLVPSGDHQLAIQLNKLLTPAQEDPIFDTGEGNE